MDFEESFKINKSAGGRGLDAMIVGVFKGK
jgi:hypothetical protein